MYTNKSSKSTSREHCMCLELFFVLLLCVEHTDCKFERELVSNACRVFFALSVAVSNVLLDIRSPSKLLETHFLSLERKTANFRCIRVNIKRSLSHHQGTGLFRILSFEKRERKKFKE